jgi:hypothetical protein
MFSDSPPDTFVTETGSFHEILQPKLSVEVRTVWTFQATRHGMLAFRYLNLSIVECYTISSLIAELATNVHKIWLHVLIGT